MTSTITTPTDAPSPAPRAPLHERLAADLRALADLVTDHPELAHDIRRAVEDLHVVLPSTSDVTHSDIGNPLIAAGARPTPPRQLDPQWATTAWLLPARAIRVTAIRLDMRSTGSGDLFVDHAPAA